MLDVGRVLKLGLCTGLVDAVARVEACLDQTLAVR